MVSPSWDLGSLGVFEAVGRLENLTLAARELGMTQPAVSYQIKRIEERLGVALFARRARGVEILPEGRILYEAVRSGLDGIDEAVQQIKRRQRAPGLRIATDYGFATFWLMPRVAQFRPKHPEVDVRITASSMLQPLDRRDADISVLFGGREDFPKDAIAFIGEKSCRSVRQPILPNMARFRMGNGWVPLHCCILIRCRVIAGSHGSHGSMLSVRTSRTAITGWSSTPIIW